MRQQFNIFLLRWALNSIGLWVAIRLLGGLGATLSGEETVLTFLFAGLVFSVVNGVLRPLVIVLSLPAILLTLGLFMLIVNGFLVWLSVKLVPGIEMTFLASIIAGMIISLVNYGVTGLIELNNKPRVRVTS